MASENFIGLMTGTSADSLDGCIVSFDEEFHLLESMSIDISENYKSLIEKAINKGFKQISESRELYEAEISLNNKSVELINNLIQNSNLNRSDISAVGFSGQTVFHTYQKSYQIGNPQNIADNSMINVISDFRNFDIKNGGIGAPLIPIFHQYLFGKENCKKIILNIGGIANGTYLDGREIKLASDIGPGNCLMDLVAEMTLNTNFDPGGETASKGNIIQELLEKLHTKCAHMNYPRADDKQDYYKILNVDIKKHNNEDLLRTLAEFTADKILEFFKHCESPEEMIIHGGGINNHFLMGLIKEKLNVQIKTSDFKIPSKFVESAAFAYLAFLEKGEIFLAK